MSLFRNDKVAFFTASFLSLGLLFVKGSHASPGALFGPARAYVPSQNQLLDINMLTGHGMEVIVEAQNFGMIQENSLLAYNATELGHDGTDARNGITTYEVQEGDVLSEIANDFGLTVQTLVTANKIRNVDALKPGMELVIPPINGVVHKVKAGDTVSSLAKTYSAEVSRIIAFNELPLSGDLQAGAEIMIPDGKLPAARTDTTASVRNISAKRFDPLPRLVGYFVIPTTGRKSQGLHGRNGVDIANKTGTPVYAAATGTITAAQASGYNGGYGKHIKVRHPNGTSTVYAHLSAVLVKAGETVEQGQMIGKIGNTGRSTGPHLHFEVQGAANPAVNVAR